MDGVIVNSEPLWVISYHKQLEKRGLKPPTTIAYKKFAKQHYRGRSQYHSIKMMKQYYGITGSIDNLLKERLQFLFQEFDKKLKLMPGAMELFKKLSTHYPMAVASAAPRSVINYVMRRFALKKYFKTSISGDEFTHSKPHSEIFLNAVKKINIPPAHCLVIEDSSNGAKAAHRANMKCIGLKTSYNTKTDFATVNTIVPRLSAITLTYIKSL